MVKKKKKKEALSTAVWGEPEHGHSWGASHGALEKTPEPVKLLGDV